jgi:hypothetical protein
MSELLLKLLTSFFFHLTTCQADGASSNQKNPKYVHEYYIFGAL